MTTPRQGLTGAVPEHSALARRVGTKRFLARLVLLTERVLPLTMLPLGILALFLSFSWFGLFRFVPDWLRWVILFGFVFSFLTALLPLARLRWPKPVEADRLLEERNNLPHQPVSVQADRLASESPFARALWQEHQTRMAARIADLDAGLPQPDIASHDRFALRIVPALLLVTSFAYSFSNGSGTLEDAVTQHTTPAMRPDMRIDAWITPPSYTGRAPLYLTGNDAAATKLDVPQFSDLTVRITGGDGTEKVLFKGENAAPVELTLQDGDKKKTEEPAADKAAETPVDTTAARNHLMKLAESGTLDVGGRNWQFNVIPDKGPEIAFDGMPRRSINGALEIGFKAKDDYGIQSAHAEIEPVDQPDAGALPLYPLPEYKLDLPRRDSREIKGLTSRNLTEHPLSGKRVRVTLVATDAAGQTGRSPPHEMVLPSRNFSQLLAAAVAEERQIFSLDVRKLPEAIALNEALTLRADETIPNLTHYLLIESARTRMQLSRNSDMLKETADYLWEIALGIEDGNLSLAERKLRDAQQALADALDRNASDAEIKKLMDELRKAMDEYLSAMADQMRNNNSAQNQNETPRNVLRQQDLQAMLDQLENLARSGNRDAAKQMLSELQRMMNNLQAGRRPQQGQQGEQNSQMRQQIDKLGEILRDQQRLMDDTFKLDQALRDRMQRGDPDSEGEDGEFLDQMQPDGQQGEQQQQSQQGENGQQQDLDRMTAEQLREALKQLRAQQDGLGKKLEELQKGLKELGMQPGEGFGEAGREMKGAGQALGESQGERAVQGQGKALEALRKGAQDMMNQMMQAQQGQGQGQEQGSAEGGQNGRDPLGRPRRAEGPDFGDQVKVPDEIDIQRAREILESIRRRLGENPAAEFERRYLERLLDIR
ncbi:TIGR02302 family protein [Rhizobium sp. LjRoot30]|uniref:TIGR02302 family protein n=1 Tax=Rhizobium sp. LjRoot30 TaxID=3342320 RepID=UPI003ED12046